MIKVSAKKPNTNTSSYASRNYASKKMGKNQVTHLRRSCVQQRETARVTFGAKVRLFLRRVTELSVAYSLPAKAVFPRIAPFGCCSRRRWRFSADIFSCCGPAFYFNSDISPAQRRAYEVAIATSQGKQEFNGKDRQCNSDCVHNRT